MMALICCSKFTPILKRGDIVFGNLEGPLVDGEGMSLKCRGKAPGHCYAFRVPTRYGALLKAAGFTVMGLANNHAMDFGQEGRQLTRDTGSSGHCAYGRSWGYRTSYGQGREGCCNCVCHLSRGVQSAGSR